MLYESLYGILRLKNMEVALLRTSGDILKRPVNHIPQIIAYVFMLSDILLGNLPDQSVIYNNILYSNRTFLNKVTKCLTDRRQKQIEIIKQRGIKCSYTQKYNLSEVG